MHQKIAVACASVALVAFTLACSSDSDSPVSPSASESGTSEAAADGSTLKASAPVAQSPVNGQQPDQLVFVAGRSTATYAGANVVFSYEFEIRNSGNTAPVCPAAIVSGGSGATVTYTSSCNLQFDQNYTWRVLNAR